MADEQAQSPEEQQEQAPLSVFITGGDSGTGLALTRMLSTDGVKVVGATEHGTDGARKIRKAGGVPVYPELIRETALASAILMAKAQVVVHLTPQAANAIPQVAQDYDALATLVKQSTESIMSAAGQTGVKRVIMVSSAAAYGDHHGEAVDEATALSTANALYKAIAQAESAVLDGGIKGYILRAGFQYGGENAALRQLGDELIGGGKVLGGNGLAGFIHEEDLASAIVALVKKDFSDDEAMATVYNIVDDNPATPDAFIDALGTELGIGQPTRTRGNLIDMLLGREANIQDDLLGHSAKPSNAKAKQELGWAVNNKTFAVGLDRTLLFWRAEEADDEEETTEDSESQALATT